MNKPVFKVRIKPNSPKNRKPCAIPNWSNYAKQLANVWDNDQYS